MLSWENADHAAHQKFTVDHMGIKKTLCDQMKQEARVLWPLTPRTQQSAYREMKNMKKGAAL